MGQLLAVGIASSVAAARARVLRLLSATPSEAGGSLAAADNRDAALSASEERYRTLVEFSPDGIMLLVDGKVGFANPAALRIFRASTAAELVGRSMMDFIHPDSMDDPASQERLTGMLAGHSDAIPRERRCLRLDGSEFQLEASTVPVSHEGRPAFLSMFREVTERRRAHDALRQQVALLELAPVAIIARDNKSLVTYWNPAAEALYGWSADAVRGQSTHEFLHTGPTALLPVVERALLDRGIWEGELRHRRSDGAEMVVSSRQALLRDEHGQPAAILEINTDVSQLKRLQLDTERARLAAEQLYEKQAIYEAAARNLTEGLMILDRADRVTFWNLRLEELLGVPADVAVGQRLTDLDALRPSASSNPDPATRISADVFVAVMKPEPTEFTWQVEGDAGLSLVVETFPVLGPTGQILGHARLVRDVSDERALSDLKDQFVSMVSHELRTPMNGIIGMTDLLLETPLDAYQREFAETIRDSGRALVEIVNDILDMSRLQAGRVELEDTELDVRAVVEHVVEVLNGEARRKRVELVGLVSRRVPHLLRGDPGRLRQILTNLVGNAIKFTERGEVCLQITWDTTEQGGRALRCEVRDTGIGIDPGAIGRLFEPFQQADSSVTRRYGGTGLGLAICKRLVAAMGGEIGATSRPSHGSTFWFTIRLTHPYAQVDPPIPTNLQHLRILIIDHQPTRRLALVEQLASWELSVETLDYAIESLSDLARSANQQVFDVIFFTTELSNIVAEFAAHLLAHRGIQTPRLVWLNPAGRANEGRDPAIEAMLASPPRQAQLFDVLAQIVEEKPASTIERHSSNPQLFASWSPPSKDAPLVLVVDDVELNRRVAERMLLRLGYRTICADSGLGALAALARTPCDLVLMDCRMPDMDGFTATLEIRATEHDERHTAIIAMTASANTSDREDCLSAGMDDYLSKPVELAALARMLSRWVPLAAGDPVIVPILTRITLPERVLDPKALAQIRDLEEPGQPSLLAEMVRGFRTATIGHVKRLKEAASAGDAGAVADAAHALKGAAAAIGAERVRAAALDLELAANDEPLTAGDRHIVVLEEAADQALAALAVELAQAA